MGPRVSSKLQLGISVMGCLNVFLKDPLLANMDNLLVFEKYFFSDRMCVMTK